MPQLETYLDTSTLDGASRVFDVLALGGIPTDEQAIGRWAHYLESLVLSDNIVVDARTFSGLSRRVSSVATSARYVRQVGIDPTESKSLKSEIYKSSLPLSGQLTPKQARLFRRILFAIHVAGIEGAAYRPNQSRVALLESVVSQRELSTPQVYSLGIRRDVLEMVGQAIEINKARLRELAPSLMVKATLPPLGEYLAEEARKRGTWSEAIWFLRESKALKHFKEWTNELAAMMKSNSEKGVRKLAEVSSFIKGWGDGTIDGTKYQRRKLGIAWAPGFLSLPEVSVRVRDPILNRPKHLLFLSQVYQVNSQKLFIPDSTFPVAGL